MANRKTLAIIPGRFDAEELEDLKQVIETYTYKEIPEQMERRGHRRRTHKAYIRTANRNGFKINWGENGRPLRRLFTPDEVAAIELLAPTTPIPQMPVAMEAAGFEPRKVSSYYDLASKLGIKIKTNRHTTTNKDIELIKSLRWEGRTERQIAAVIGMTRAMVNTIINKHKFRIKPGIALRKIRPRRFTPDEVAAIELLALTTPISHMPAAMEAAGFEPWNDDIGDEEIVIKMWDLTEKCKTISRDPQNYMQSDAEDLRVATKTLAINLYNRIFIEKRYKGKYAGGRKERVAKDACVDAINSIILLDEAIENTKFPGDHGQRTKTSSSSRVCGGKVERRDR